MERFRRLDEMVGSKDDHLSVGVILQADLSSQANAGGGIATRRLTHNVRARDLGKLFNGPLDMRRTRDHQDVLRADEPRNAIHRLLQQGAIPVQSQKLLGQRPP
jgi:hypothetical protein